MATPGWYPDPGDPTRVRRWDGRAWTEDNQPAAAGGRRPPTAWLVVAAAVGIALLVAVLVWPRNGGTAAPDTNTARPEGSVWDERGTNSSPPPTSPEVQETGSDGTPTSCPLNSTQGGERRGDRLAGGGISVVVPAGFTPDYGYSRVLVDQTGASKSYAGSTWSSLVTVGLARRSDGFRDTATTARQVLECHLTSSSFTGGSRGYETRSSQPVQVDGRDGWRLSAHAPSTRAPGGGAFYEVVVVDRGDPTGFAVYWGGAVDADADAVAAVSDAVATLQID